MTVSFYDGTEDEKITRSHTAKATAEITVAASGDVEFEEDDIRNTTFYIRDSSTTNLLQTVQVRNYGEAPASGQRLMTVSFYDGTEDEKITRSHTAKATAEITVAASGDVELEEEDIRKTTFYIRDSSTTNLLQTVQVRNYGEAPASGQRLMTVSFYDGTEDEKITRSHTAKATAEITVAASGDVE